MPRVAFTPQLRRFVDAPEVQCDATTLRDALATVFETNPRLRSYVIGDQGHLRPNVVVFIDGRRSALALVSDNNFGAAQFTQFVALAVTVPIPEPTTALLWAAGALVLVARVRTQRQSPSM